MFTHVRVFGIIKWLLQEIKSWKDGYRVRRELSKEETKKRLVDLLVEFDRVCKENEIEYFLAFGTLLGAVREKGFIPWDDDIDVYISRDGMTKFVSVINAQENQPFVAEVKNHSRTDIAERMYFYVKNSFSESGGKGILIDCFVLDRIDNVKKWERLNKMLLVKDIQPRKGRSFLKSCVIKLAKLLLSFRTEERICKAMLECKSEEGGVLTIIAPPYDFHLYKYEWFEHPIELQYEGRMFAAPCGYDALLTGTYGDYLTPPPASERTKVFQKVWIED